jgi:hypothetical protein
MRTQSPDTHPDVEEVQIDLLRRATVARRCSLACSLSQTAIQLARRAIRRAHPDADEEEIGLIFIATHYGQELADRVRADLARRRR